MNNALIYLYRIIYGVCLFTLSFRYSVGHFIIHIVKVVNKGLIELHGIIYGVCLFTLAFVIQFICSLFKSKM